MGMSMVELLPPTPSLQKNNSNHPPNTKCIYLKNVAFLFANFDKHTFNVITKIISSTRTQICSSSKWWYLHTIEPWGIQHILIHGKFGSTTFQPFTDLSQQQFSVLSTAILALTNSIPQHLQTWPQCFAVNI